MTSLEACDTPPFDSFLSCRPNIMFAGRARGILLALKVAEEVLALGDVVAVVVQQYAQA